MQFHSAHHRDDRRRRAIVEERAATGDDAAAVKAAGSPRRKTEAYAPGAKPQNQRRVIDLVPHNFVVLGLWFLVGLTVIVGLAAGHLWMPDLAHGLAQERLGALDLGGAGGLANWFASLVLGLAGLTSLLVFSIRRHKLDDYRGRYRWWLLAAAMWLVMSMDATAGIHDLFRAAMVHFTGKGLSSSLTTSHSPLATSAVWWIGCWGLLLLAVSVRLLWEMKVCRPASLTYLAALGCWAGGLALALSGVSVGKLGSVVPTEVCKLLGHLLLLSSLVLYARHVILHSQGLLPNRKKLAKEKARREAKLAAEKAAAEASGSATRIDAAHATPTQPRTDLQPHIKPAAQLSYSSSDDDDEDEVDDDSSQRNRKLSKAERKRLRQLKAQERGW